MPSGERDHQKLLPKADRLHIVEFDRRLRLDMDPEAFVLADLERAACTGLDLHQRSLTLTRNHRQPLRIQGEA